MLGGYKEIANEKIGVFGITKEVQHIQSGKIKCLKCIKKKNHDPKQLELKRSSLIRLKAIKSEILLTPEIVEEDENYIYVVTDLAKGEELQRYVISNKRLDERTSLIILRSLISIIEEYLKFGLISAFLKK